MTQIAMLFVLVGPPAGAFIFLVLPFASNIIVPIAEAVSGILMQAVRPAYICEVTSPGHSRPFYDPDLFLYVVFLAFFFSYLAGGFQAFLTGLFAAIMDLILGPKSLVPVVLFAALVGVCYAGRLQQTVPRDFDGALCPPGIALYLATLCVHAAAGLICMMLARGIFYRKKRAD